jgi:DNA-binding response OmpR family regulator
MNILVVDDHPDVLALLRANVQAWGHDCFTAASAAEARDILESSEVDVMFLDVSMPDVDGVTFLTQIRSEGLEPDRVALVSALPSDELQSLSDELGVAYLQKPFTSPMLRGLFERLMGKPA